MKKNRRKTFGKLVTFICVFAFLLSAWILAATNIEIDTETEIVEIGSTYIDKKPAATIFGFNASAFVKETGTVDTSKLGEYTITCESFLTSEKYQKIVKVVDLTKPEIKLVGEGTVYVKSIEAYEEPGYTATDNCDGDIKDTVVSQLLKIDDNHYEMEYIAKDSSGNLAAKRRIIKIYKGTVYLTFDDGPSHNNTPKILDILKEKNVTATFFVIGYDDSKSEIIKRMVDEGHTIGLHGMTHEYSKFYTSVDATMENFYKIEELVSQTTAGYTSKIIRFPGGSSNTVSKKYCKGVMTAAAKRATEEGYIYYDWNVDSMDAGGAKTSEEIFENVIRAIRPNRSNVVLMHDAGDKTNTVLALEKIIDYCIQNDYLVKAIDDNTVEVHHGISN